MAYVVGITLIVTGESFAYYDGSHLSTTGGNTIALGTELSVTTTVQNTGSDLWDSSTQPGWVYQLSNPSWSAPWSDKMYLVWNDVASGATDTDSIALAAEDLPMATGQYSFVISAFYPEDDFSWNYLEMADTHRVYNFVVVMGVAGQLRFSRSAFTNSENAAATTVTVIRINGSNAAVTVQYATSNGTAVAGFDYVATSGTLAFGAGVTSRTFAVTNLDDSAREGDETVNLRLFNPSGGAALASPSNAVLTIVDNDRQLVVVSSRGSVAPPVGTNIFASGSTQTCTVLSSPITSGGTQYVCSGWIGTGDVPAGGATTNTGPFILTNDSAITWQWSTNYLLATQTNGCGSVAGSNGWYAAGSSTALVAAALTNWHFVRWEGDTNGCAWAGNVITAAMTQARTISARFELNTKTLMVISAWGGAYPGSLTTNWGTTLSQWVTNSPVSGGALTQYVCTAGVVAGNQYALVNPTNITLTLTNNATLTWNWQTNYWLAITTNNGTVNQTNGWRPATGQVAVISIPSQYWHSDGWSGQTNGASILASNQFVAIMNTPRQIQACFAMNCGNLGTPQWWLASHGFGGDPSAAELLDTDADRMAAWEEWIAGTNPTNQFSCLRVLYPVALGGGTGSVVRWTSETGRLYAVERSTNLAPDALHIIVSNLDATIPTNSYSDLAATNKMPYFYRVRAKQK